MVDELSKLNFRDLGGLHTTGSGLVRPGVIFRSEGPASFGPVHRSELAALGIRLVCDLRTDAEREVAPNDWAGSARLLNLNVTDALRSGPSEWTKTLEADPTVDAIKRTYLGTYEQVPGAIRSRLRELIQAIADGETPVLIHCTAGKDRTGVLVALLLLALGVPEAVVKADYLRSDIFAQNLRQRGGLHEQFEGTFGFRPDDAFVDAMIGVDVAFLDAALQAVQVEWGSIDGYFTAAGIDPDLMSRYRSAMTTQPADKR